MNLKDYFLGLVLDKGQPSSKKAMTWVTFFSVIGEFIYKNIHVKDTIQDMPMTAVTLILVLAGFTTWGGTKQPSDGTTTVTNTQTTQTKVEPDAP